MRVVRRPLWGLQGQASRQNQDLRDLQDFAFAQLALFFTTENPAKTNTDERFLVFADALDESCKSYNPANPDSDKMPAACKSSETRP